MEAVSSEKKIVYSYHPLGRRLHKTLTIGHNEESEHYLYHEQHEIGAFVSQKPKNFRVLGLARNDCPSTIAIELEGEAYAPILDVQGNVRKLINLGARAVDSYNFTAFGEELTDPILPNPWRFASKRFDSELNLIYFGKRYYTQVATLLS